MMIFESPESTTALTRKFEFKNDPEQAIKGSEKETNNCSSQSVQLNASKKLVEPSQKQSSLFLKQLKFEGLVSHIRFQINLISAIFWHYEIISLIMVIVIHSIKLESIVISSVLFCLNALANGIYSLSLFSFTVSRSQLLLTSIVKAGTFPLPIYNSIPLTETNSLNDVMFCLYLHRFYYLIHLMAFYNQKLIDKGKENIFKTQFKYGRTVLRNGLLQKYGRQTLTKLKKETGMLSRQLIVSVNEQITQERALHAKFLLHYKPFALTSFLIVFSTIILSYAFQQAETPIYDESYSGTEQKDVRNFQNDLYFMSITIRTIGYGDIYPQSMLGKVLSCIASLWGLFFTSIALYIFNTYFKLSNSEKNEYGIYSEFEEAETKKITQLEQRNILKYTNLITDLSGIHSTIDRQYSVSENEMFITKIKSSNMFNRLLLLNQS